MKRYLKTILSFSVMLMIVFGSAGQSLFASGEWYKIAVLENGVYQLDMKTLQKAGFSYEGVLPENLKIYTSPVEGMLSQFNNQSTYGELVECAISVVDGGDGKLDRDDYLLFYGKSPHLINYNEVYDFFDFEENIYSDTVFYFLTVDESSEGLRIENENASTENPTNEADLHRIWYYLEGDENLLHTGRDWYGHNFSRSGDHFDVIYRPDFFDGNIAVDSRVSAMGASLDDVHYIISINEIVVGILTIPGRSTSDNANRGYERQLHVQISNISLEDGVTTGINFVPSNGSGYGYLDDVVYTLSGKINEAATGNFSVFSDEAAYFNYDGDATIWDVTNPENPQIKLRNASNQYFVSSNQVQDVILFDEERLLAPVSVARVPNQDLKSDTNVEYLIITHGDFKTDAEQLAAYRASKNELNVKVATVGEVYNDFSGGRCDVTALRDYIKYLYDRGSLKSVLLFGAASYDYRDKLDNNTNFVPTYESRYSLSENLAYASDDYFVFLEDDEGFWIENSGGNHTMDIAIGRLPILNTDQAATIVNKIIDYETNNDFGWWKTKLLYSADDGDENQHMIDADVVANEIENEFPFFSIEKLYIDAYPATGDRALEAEERFANHVQDGRLLVDYVGHGNQELLAAEKLVVADQLEGWEDNDRLPFWVTATCDFGVYDNPSWYSGGMKALFSEGAAIGFVTASRTVNTLGNFQVNQNFHDYVFMKEEGQYLTLGEIFRRTKNVSQDKIISRSYVLLADPMMKLNLPEANVVFDSLNHETNQFYGHISAYNDGLDTAFNGAIAIRIYDDVIETQSLGQDGDPFSYQTRESILYAGLFEVENGVFGGILNLPSSAEHLKIVGYAVDSLDQYDAVGALELDNLSVSSIPDTESPAVEVYVENLQFQNGDIVPANTQLIVNVADNIGFDFRNQGADNFNYLLDGEGGNMAEYFTPTLNQANKGVITIPLRKLTAGTHSVVVNVADFNGNTTQKEVQFKVAKLTEIPLNNFRIYPNPIANQDMAIAFEQPFLGDYLVFDFKVIDLAGNVVYHVSKEISGSPLSVDELIWTASQQQDVKAGIYLYLLEVEALAAEAKASKSGRIVFQ